MSKQRNSKHRKTAAVKNASVESEILEALSEFTDALKKGEVAKRFTCRQIKQDRKPTQLSRRCRDNWVP